MADIRTILDPFWTAEKPSYYTITNLQTSGQALVHFNNLTNKPTTLAGYGITDAINIAEKGAANGVAPLGADTKIPSIYLPSIAITETFVVGSQAAMLALTAQVGDVAVRTDLSKTFILAAEPATILANWQELLTPGAPVQSVNGQTGNVNLTTTQIAEGTNLYYTDTRARVAISGLAPISYDNSTGVISIVNAAADGVTKGAATFTASDFNATAGLISIDYTNGQAASSLNKGFLTSADWTTFNSKAPGSGSPNYIQNTTSLQAASNFHISGTGQAETAFQVLRNGSASSASQYILSDAAGNERAALQLTEASPAGISFWVANAEKARFTSSSMGIGTTNPLYALHVSAGNGDIAAHNTNTLGINSGGQVAVLANGTPSVADQRLGIFAFGSTTSPTVPRNGAFVASYSDDVWTDGVSHPAYIAFRTVPSGSTFDTEKMRITSSGNVGINIVGPTAKLHVFGTVKFDLGSDATGDIFYRDSGGSFTRLGIGSANQILTVSSGLPSWSSNVPSGSGNYIQNQIAAAQSTSNAWVSGSVFASGANGFRIVNNGGFIAGYESTNTTRSGYLQFNSASATILATDISQPLVFQTGGSERVRIDTSGNVGVGITSPFSNVHVKLAGASFGATSTTAFGATSGGWVYLLGSGTPSAANQKIGTVLMGSAPTDTNPRPAVLIEAYSEAAWTDNVSHPSFLRFSTTATSSNSATERMRIASDGTTGIGTNAPFGRLHISDATTTGLNVQNTSAFAANSGGFGRFINSGTPSGAGHRLGGFIFGSNPSSTTVRQGGIIQATANAAWTDGSSHPTDISFWTCPSASINPLQRMTIIHTGEVGINTTPATGMRLDVSGTTRTIGMVWGISTITTTTTLDSTHNTVICNSAGGAITVNLPAAASNTGRVYSIKRSGTNNVTIDPNSAELIDGAATKVLITNLTGVMIQCDGTGWQIIASYTSLL